MNTVIKSIVAVLVALTVVFYGGAYVLPGEVRVERSIDIAAPPERVFVLAGDLRRWPDWSPLLAIDPDVTFTFEGPPGGGVGQVLRWRSANPMAGQGTHRVTGHAPRQSLMIETTYENFGTATAGMSLAPEGGGTRVTWTFQSSLPGVIDRWAGLMIDRMVGSEYEAGLARLKALAEAE
jgi:hypothetical protein